MKAKLLKVGRPWDSSYTKGVAKTYELTPPLEGHKIVVVSAALLSGSGPETYIFPGSIHKGITNYGELAGSQKGTLDHEQVLRDLGYKIIKSKKRSK